MRRIPHRYAHVVFGLLLSGLMSFLVAGIATLRALGLVDGFAVKWLTAWLGAWSVAFPAVLVVAPVVRRLVSHICEPPILRRESGAEAPSP